jgi:hypothetical protein
MPAAHHTVPHDVDDDHHQHDHNHNHNQDDHHHQHDASTVYFCADPHGQLCPLAYETFNMQTYRC